MGGLGEWGCFEKSGDKGDDGGAILMRNEFELTQKIQPRKEMTYDKADVLYTPRVQVIHYCQDTRNIEYKCVHACAGGPKRQIRTNCLRGN